MTNSELVAQIRTKYQAFLPYLNERTQRIWAGIEATALGRGGISQVSRATGLSRTTIYTGLRELQNRSERADSTDGTSRIRQAGGGRKKLTEIDPTLMDDLKGLVESSTRGDPESPLLWTCKSTTKLAKELRDMGHRVSERTICTLLANMAGSCGFCGVDAQSPIASGFCSNRDQDSFQLRTSCEPLLRDLKATVFRRDLKINVRS